MVDKVESHQIRKVPDKKPMTYDVNVENIIRSIFFDSYLLKQDIVYDDAIEYVMKCIDEHGDKEWGCKYLTYGNAIVYNTQNNIDTIKLKIRDQINQLYRKALCDNNILSVRLPEDISNGERYEKIIICKNNRLEDLFNRRVIRENCNDLMYSKLDKLVLKNFIISNGNIRYPVKYLEAIEKLK